jgi:hypothetical protein
MRILTGIILLLTLAGCQTQPKEPHPQVELAPNQHPAPK